LRDEDKTRGELLEEIARLRTEAESKKGKRIPHESSEDAPSGIYGFYSLLIDNMMDMITVLDREGRIVFNSRPLKEILGYEPGELNGKYAFELVHPDDLEMLAVIFSRGVQTPDAVGSSIYRFRCKDGSWRYLESIFNNLLEDPVVGAIVVCSRDISDRIRMQEELRRSEEYFKAVAEDAMDLFVIIDGEATIKYVNRTSLRLLGFEPDELVGGKSTELIHPDDAVWAVETIARAMRDSDYSPLSEIRIRRKDGTWCHLEGVGKNFLDHPAVNGIVLSFRDITDRVRAEKGLRDSEEMHRTLVATSPDAVTVTDLDGRITYVSQQTLEMHEYESDEEILGKTPLIFIDPEDHARAATTFEKVWREGAMRNVEFTGVRKSGERFFAELNGTLIRDSHGEPKSLVAFTREITERKLMEKELRNRNEELEAFAHTISHDLLSPVAIVEGYAKAALEADAEGRPEAERECLEAITRGARRMSDLINSLLQYAHAGHVDLDTYGIDAEEVLMEVLMDLEEEIRGREARIDLQEDLPCVKVDKVKLRQVFANLVSNALRHMGDGREPLVLVNAQHLGGNAVFCVRDNGIGIPLELQERIFEPFRHFSLSGSPGLGIGLSTVKRAVKAWGGEGVGGIQPRRRGGFLFHRPYRRLPQPVKGSGAY